MDELINKQEVVDLLMERASLLYGIYGDLGGACSGAAKLITQLPSAEPKIIHCEDCKYGIRDSSFPYQWFCKFKGDEWNNGDYFCGHARKREVVT